MKLLYILGRQPAIGQAELESLYGSRSLTPIGIDTVLVETDKEIPFERIGGAVKASKLLTLLNTTDWREIQKYLEKSIPTHLKGLPEGKLHLGISVHDLKMSPQKITATGLSLKKVIRFHQRSVRLVPNSDVTLSSAQVLHNKLTGPLGWEFIIAKHGQKTILAQTTSVQDIDSYTLRDRGRPKRDARVGMLPPKLAQIIINLATGQPNHYKHKPYILDPFCGTGVILQEALLNGYFAMGSDLEQRMVDYTLANIKWLSEKFKERGTLLNVDTIDATSGKWTTPFDTVACETYLGRPFTSPPDNQLLQKNRQDCDTIIRKFLENIHKQVKPETRFCLAVPAWFVNNTIYHLKTLDSLEEIGYNRISFVHAAERDLIYHREGQIVGRELVVMKRK